MRKTKIKATTETRRLIKEARAWDILVSFEELGSWCEDCVSLSYCFKNHINKLVCLGLSAKNMKYAACILREIYRDAMLLLAEEDFEESLTENINETFSEEKASSEYCDTSINSCPICTENYSFETCRKLALKCSQNICFSCFNILSATKKFLCPFCRNCDGPADSK